MSVTGTNLFTVTRDDIIKATLRLLGVIGSGETPTTEDFTNCSQALNIMIKSWAKKGLPLWVVQDLPIPMVTGVLSYTLGPTGGAIGLVTVISGGTGYSASGTWTSTGGTTGTTASGTYTSTGGVITSITVTNGGTSYTSASITITFSGGGSGATYTAYIAGINMSRPLRIVDAFIRDSNNLDTTLLPISRQEYDIQGSKTSAGTPNQFYYDRQEPTGTLFVFNVPSDVTHTIHAQIQRQFFDMTSSTDNFDFPEEFFQALKWGLASELLAEYSISLEMIPYYEQKASMYIEESFNSSVEEASIFFSVDSRTYGQHG